MKDKSEPWSPFARRSGRYGRPGWHKAIGAVLVVIGLGMIGINLAMEFGAPKILPGGHNVLYLAIGIGITFSSLWPFGWMDR